MPVGGVSLASDEPDRYDVLAEFEDSVESGHFAASVNGRQKS